MQAVPCAPVEPRVRIWRTQLLFQGESCLWPHTRTHTHAHSTCFSSSHLSQSLRLSLCCHWIVEEESERTSGRRAVQWCNWWCKHLKLFTFLSFFIWQMRFKLSSSVTLSSSAPRPSPCPALPLIYWSQSPYAAINGVTYHEGFRQLGILCCAHYRHKVHSSTRRAAAHYKSVPESALPSTSSRKKEPIVHFLQKPRRVVQSRRKVQHTSGRVQKNTVLMLLCFSDGHSWARCYVSRPW